MIGGLVQTFPNAPDEKRPGILDSEIVLAFPVDDVGRALASPDCATFAFLPIRSFGFRFCVQADFLLSSAREDIQTARPWNSALRDAIAPAFVASLEHFRSRPALARTFLRFLPQDQELTHAFFAPVARQMLEALAQTECVLCATGQWRRPADVMTAPVAFQRLVPADQAWRMFAKDYPARDLDVEQGVLKKLGCLPLYIADIVKLFTDHSEWVLEQGRAWLVQYFAYLSTLNRQHLIDAGIQKAACLPVSDGSLQSPNDRTVFFPLARGKKFGFEQELRILDESFIDLIEEDDDTNIRGLLHDLGVRTPEPYTLITNHILPAHTSDRWQESAFAALTGHVRYVKAKIDDYVTTAVKRGQAETAAVETLRKGLRLKTKKNEDSTWWFERAGDVYPGHEYAPEFDIESLLGRELDPLQLLSADYLPANLEKLEPQDRVAVQSEWREFFFRLGVNRSPRLSNEANAACSSELRALLTSEVAAIRRQTLECLDRHWDHYRQHATYTPGGRPGTRYYTNFATTLRSTVTPSKQRRSVVLQEAYYPAELVRDVFGSSPTYIDAELRNEEFLDTCGIVHRADAGACIKRLKQIKSAEKPSAAQVRRVYRHLDQIFDRNASTVREAFEEHALILTRSADSPWRRPDEVVWSSPGEFLDLHYPALHSQYADSHGFFVRKLGISHEVSIAAAVRALPLLTVAGLPLETQAAEALRIYVRASRELALAPGRAAPGWLTDFETESVFLNHRGEMIAADGALYADDQPATRLLFAGHEEISFLAVPAARLPQIRVLLEAAGVPLLSESLEIALKDPGAGRPNVTLTARVRERYQYMARLVYAQSHTAFERAKAAGIWRRLSLLSVVDVDSLTICTTLQSISATTQGEVVISGESVFIRTGAKGVADRLAREICVMLAVPMTLVDGVSRILRDETIDEIEEYLDVREIPALPDDELSQLALVEAPPVAEAPDSLDAVPDTDAEAFQSSTGIAGNEPSPADANASTVSPPVASSQAPHSSLQSATSPVTQPPNATSTAADTIRSQDGTVGGSTPGSERSGSSGRSEVGFDGNARRHSGGDTAGAGWTGGVRKRRNGRRSGRATRPIGEGRRLLSYVEPVSEDQKPSDTTDGASRARERDATAQAAVRYFLQTQQAQWSTLEEMPPFNKGYDVRGIAHDGSEHFIEIKGQSAAWTAAGVALTPSELLCAADKRERYWLCVVEHAINPERQVLHVVNNPFGKVDQFRFDSGWKSVATSEEGRTPLVPAPGLHIDIQDLGRGTIFSVKKTGSMFFKVHVFLENGQQVFKVFEPARMRLSRGE
jgi:hypothetical protein